jgi:hypothetical protein
MQPPLSASPLDDRALAGAEPLLEDLDLAAAALDNLAARLGVDEAGLLRDDGWGARVEVDGVTVLVRARGDRWSIYNPAGGDEADGMLAARRLHGLLGAFGDGWDLDR